MAKETVLKLADNFEFSVDYFNVNYNPADKTKSLTFTKYFKDIKIREVENNLTPENMKTIKVLKSGSVVYELDGYTEITSMDVNIDKETQVFTVRAVQAKASVAGGDNGE